MSGKGNGRCPLPIGVPTGGGMIPFGISPIMADSREMKMKVGGLRGEASKGGSLKAMAAKAEKRGMVLKEDMTAGKDMALPRFRGIASGAALFARY